MTKPQSLRFGPHELQELLVWLPEDAPGANDGPVLWIVLIHGGAWRDPTITHLSFAEPAVSILLSPSSPVSALLTEQQTHRYPRRLAVASLSYRLSPHPSHRQDPETTPTTSLRNARHPEHLDDICTGLTLLRDAFGLAGDNYIVVGHSCGATLAFQALERSYLHHGNPDLPPLKALVGLAGIYDLRLLLDNHKDGPYGDIYASFIQGAFGQELNDWDRASPAHFSESGMYSGMTVLLVTAQEDELVEPAQREAMRRAILDPETLQREQDLTSLTAREFVLEHKGCKYAELSVEGGHDEMWLVGERMVAAIERAIQIMTTPVS